MKIELHLPSRDFVELCSYLEKKAEEEHEMVGWYTERDDQGMAREAAEMNATIRRWIACLHGEVETEEGQK